MAKKGRMRSVEVRKANGPLRLVERDVPEPSGSEVRVKVAACGICHSDALTKAGLWPGLVYPRVPGHEIAGAVDRLGPDARGWEVGDRVGIGWHGGHCGVCESCRRGDFVTCRVEAQVPGISYDGGYADYVIVPAAALARIPEALTFTEAAPLMCAGITTFNPLRHSGARPPELVAVLGIGGLGHLGVQFASRMGFRTVAIARGKDKEPLARRLGAHEYIDSLVKDPGRELSRMGGARVILATATSGKAMNAVLPGLGIDGTLFVLGGADEPIAAPAGLLIGGRRSVRGWPSGKSIESQDTLDFAALNGVRPMVEVCALEGAADGYERMMSGQARFRVVLTTGNLVAEEEETIVSR